MSVNDKCDLVASQSVERFARFQSLEAGKYWRCRVAHKDDKIPAGRVLLISSIKWVDNQPHTIELAGHPIHNPHTTYTYRVKEFLAHFDPAADGEKVRAEEMASVQSGIALLQDDLGEAASGVLDAMFIEQVSRRLPAPARSDDGPGPATINGDRSVGSLIVSGSGNQTALAAMRIEVARAQALAEAKTQYITERTDNLSKQLELVANFAHERVKAALAITEDVRALAERLMAGIATLDLYVGTGVDVETICEGAGAAAEEPLTILQSKLFVEEELSVYTDFDDGDYDYRKYKNFFKALSRYPRLRDQILPTPRCVVLMQWRRHERHYTDDPIVNFHANRPNLVAWLLIRNGENLHVVQPPEQYSLKDGVRLFPSKNEVDGVFRGLDGEQIRFEDLQYTKSLEDHEKLALHYKRFLILLCGLQDRLALLGDFAGPRQPGWMLNRDAQEQYFQFIRDDETERLLGDGYKPLGKWVEDANKHLRSGSRVLCFMPALVTSETAPGAFSKSWSSRDRQRQSVESKDDVVLAIAQKDGPEIVVRLPVTQEVYRRGEGHHAREFDLRVSLTRAGSGWVDNKVAYLCLDAVTAEEISRYIHNRHERRHYALFIRFFKAAHTHLLEVAKHEAPTRRALEQVGLAAGHDPRTVSQAVKQAVMAWRASNRGAMLPASNDPKYHRAVAAMGAQIRSLLGSNHLDWVARAELLARDEGRAPLRLVLGGNNRFYLYLDALPNERQDFLYTHCYVQRLVVEMNRKGFSIASRKWTFLPAVTPAESVIHEWPDAAEAIVRHPPLSYQQRAEAAQICQDWRARLESLLAKRGDDDACELMESWHARWREYMSHSKVVDDISFFVPVGLLFTPGRAPGDAGVVRWVGIEIDCLPLLHAICPPDVWRVARAAYAGMFKNKSAGEEHASGIEGRKDINMMLRIHDLPAHRLTGGPITYVDTSTCAGTFGPLNSASARNFGSLSGKDKEWIKHTQEEVDRIIKAQTTYLREHGSPLRVREQHYHAPKHLWFVDGLLVDGEFRLPFIISDIRRETSRADRPLLRQGGAA